MGKNRLYMMVTTDEYELPIAVAETLCELADMVGVKVSTIYSSMSHYKAGSINKTPYVKVSLDEEGSEDGDRKKDVRKGCIDEADTDEGEERDVPRR